MSGIYGRDYDNSADIDPFAEPGADLLAEVEAFLSRFVAFPSTSAAVAVTLWSVHAHLTRYLDNTPRLALLSPEPGSGKTRTLEVLELLVPRPMHVLSASPAAVFRSIETEQPTLLMDEVDAIFGRRGGGDDGSEDLRGLLNAGHRAGATVPRCVGASHEVRRFPVFAPVALAGLGDLPDTLMSRAVIIRMRRRAPHERIESYRHRVHSPEGNQLHDRLVVWASGVAGQIQDAWPAMPAGVEDRPADVWEPLLAVADAAGEPWPERARTACLELIQVAATREASLGVKLLTDLRDVFGDVDALATEVILDRLHELEESPWADLHGKPLDPRGLARRLRKYEVTSTKVKADGKALQGYRREPLWDAWTRYLPALPAAEAEPPEPVEPRRSEAQRQVPHAPEVPEPHLRTEPWTAPLTSAVPQVPEVPDSRRVAPLPDLEQEGPRPADPDRAASVNGDRGWRTSRTVPTGTTDPPPLSRDSRASRDTLANGGTTGADTPSHATLPRTGTTVTTGTTGAAVCRLHGLDLQPEACYSCEQIATTGSVRGVS